ncbi:hypothetical protein SASPL_122093 [Salvia splendens]|uniref:Late embryogenesis abundant protein LEA-2 subgroup domain-containing protein n=1 Tax=Salvia splendens TaxID=180675 RepID=A0A8X8XHI1_SALSN|nr:hypothetical protein SASPL_122093 [Salvia splendens]
MFNFAPAPALLPPAYQGRKESAVWSPEIGVALGQDLVAGTPMVNMIVTLAARNSNQRIGIYYDRVDVYAAYHGQQITLPTLLPPTYQGHKDSAVWSPFLYGDAVPVAPELGVALGQDQIAGTLMVNIRVRGRIRWKVGTFVSGGYHLYVNCLAFINSGGRSVGIGGGGEVAVKYQLVMDCHVDV